MAKDRINEHALAAMRLDVLREWLVENNVSQSLVAKRAAVAPSLVSMIVSGKRLPSELTLQKMVKAIGKPDSLTYERLEQEAAQRLADARLFSDGDFPPIAVGWSPDSLLFSWATRMCPLPYLRSEQSYAGSRRYSRPFACAETRVASELLNLVAASHPSTSEKMAPFGFCLTNLRLAEQYEMAHKVGLRWLTGWRTALNPGFCLIEATPPQEMAVPRSFMARRHQLNDCHAALNEVLKDLGGKTIMVERGTEFEQNVKKLIGAAGLVLVTEDEWREKSTWPYGVEKNAVLVVHAPAIWAFYGLRRGLFSRDVIIAGGAWQNAAVRMHSMRAPALQVLLTDVELFSALPKSDPITDKWYASGNVIVAGSNDSFGEAEWEVAAKYFHELFAYVQALKGRRVLEIAAYVLAKYDQHFRRHDVMTDLLCEELIRNTFIERVAGVPTARFVPIQEGADKAER